MKLVAIHQPNFFPWLGYFDKMARCDVFVFLDHVQFPKTGGTWSNRVMMRVGGEARWVTAPIKRAFGGVANVNEIEWADEKPWREKLVKTLAANYGRAPYFRETMGLIAPLVLQPESNLSRFNMHVVLAIADCLGVRHDHCVPSSQLQTMGTASDLLIDITQKVGGDSYICGGGAGGYQDDASFAASSVKLIYQNFVHPVYEQTGGSEFLPGLSIIDALMNAGADGIRSMLRLR